MTHQRSGTSTSLNADYKATYGEVSGGFSQDKYQRTTNVGLQGGMIAHANGLTLSQPLGETIALVKAPGAQRHAHRQPDGRGN